MTTEKLCAKNKGQKNIKHELKTQKNICGSRTEEEEKKTHFMRHGYSMCVDGIPHCLYYMRTSLDDDETVQHTQKKMFIAKSELK